MKYHDILYCTSVQEYEMRTLSKSGDFSEIERFEGRMEEKRKTENDVTEMDEESELQQVEGEIWTSW